jgi:DNA (cytosine-5)-methyltransferase 1
MNYYNEFNPKTAQWLRNLITGGKIPQGIVDERSITEVHPDELKKYTQCHFFAGVAGWSYALQLAGWPADRPVWTGSCPCQPFSFAGRQKGKNDDRHLWPVWERLIRECRPPIIFGEQVAGAITHRWLDDVYEGLEEAGYAVGAVVLPACSVGAPHKRDRLWFVANAIGRQYGARVPQSNQWAVSRTNAEDSLPNPPLNRRGQGNQNPQGRETGIFKGERALLGDNNSGIVADPQSAIVNRRYTEPQIERTEAKQERRKLGGYSKSNDWSNGIWVRCSDGKQRLVEPSIRLLADGVPARVVRLRAYGNAIVPQVAAEIIKAVM